MRSFVGCEQLRFVKDWLQIFLARKRSDQRQFECYKN